MNDMQQVVDELRFILQREIIEKSAELLSLVDAYSGFCHAANLRLRKCDEFLRQGLRSEALHLADASPNLLDVVAILDFAERGELIDLLNLYFVPLPVPLLLDAAASLNAAYSEQEPLERLLDLHRLLAVGRASLNQRLVVLRSLSDFDSSSLHWDIDLREMERARFRELDAESAAAFKASDLVRLKQLTDELQESPWLEPVPGALTRDVKSRMMQCNRGYARQRIAQLATELHTAFSELDVATARRLREEWKQKLSVAQLNDSDASVEQVGPIMAWLEDEDRKLAGDRQFAKVVAEIEQALSVEQTSLADLQRLRSLVGRLEKGLPPTLERRFASRLSSVQLRERRQRRLKLGMGLGAAAAVAVLFGFIVLMSMEGEKTRRLVSTINAFLDDGKLDDARNLMAQHPQRTSEGWLAAKKRLTDAYEQEQTRAAAFQKELTKVTVAADAGAAESALKQARELAKTAEEKIEVTQLEANWRKQAQIDQGVREQKYRELIKETSDKLKLVDASLLGEGSPDFETAKSTLHEIERELAQLLPGRKSVANELASQATLLESRGKAARQSIEDLSKREELLSKLTETVLIPPETALTPEQERRYEETLKKFAADLPRDPHAAALKFAAETCPLAATLARQKLVHRWRRLRPADAKEAEARVKEIRAFFAAFPQSPDRELLSQYENWLTSILRRFSEDGDPDEGIRQRFQALFSTKFIKDAQVVLDNKGNTYYLTKAQSTPFGNPAGLNYFVGFNGETNKESLKTEELLSLTSNAPPQQELAAKIRTAIKHVTLEGWRDYFQEQIETLLKADKLDPFLRYLLVLKTVEFAGQGDALLEQDLAAVYDRLNDDEIDRSVPWMDPKSKSAAVARQQAQEVLSKLPPVAPLFAAAMKRQDQFERDLFAVRFSMGWLEKTRRGDWVCRTKWLPQTDHQLFIVMPRDEKGLRKWSSVGSLRGKSIQLDPAAVTTAGEGAVVYAATAQSDPKAESSN